VVFFVGGVAFLTTVVNATTAPMLVSKLGITAIPHAKRSLLMYMHRQLVRRSKLMKHPEEVTQALQRMLSDTEHHIDQEPVSGSMRAMRTAGMKRQKTFLERISGQHAFFVTRALNHFRQSGLSGLVAEAQDNGDLVEMFALAQQEFDALPVRSLHALGDLPSMPSQAELQEMTAMIRETGIDEGMAKVVSETFLMLVYSQYWNQLQAGELMPGSREVKTLLTSIQLAQGYRCDLIDFRYVATKLESYSAGKLSVSERTTRTMKSGIGVQLLDSKTFSLVIGATILLNAPYLAIESLVRQPGAGTGAVWLAIEAVFTGIFTIEMLVKLYYMGWSYFCKGWCIFEGSLVLSSILGLVFDLSGSLWRISLLFQDSRILRMARLYRILRTSAKGYFGAAVCEDVADSMVAISTLLAFAKAHIASQRDFVKFFGVDTDAVIGGDHVDNPEVARCLLQSQMAVYKAIGLAVAEAEFLPPAMLHRVNAQHESRRVAEGLQHFVIEAHHAGVIDRRDAESMLHPLHEHMQRCTSTIKDCEDGVLQVAMASSSTVGAAILSRVGTHCSRSSLETGASVSEEVGNIPIEGQAQITPAGCVLLGRMLGDGSPAKGAGQPVTEASDVESGVFQI